MNIPPYSIFPNISGHQINLQQIRPSDISDILQISFFDGVKALSLEQAKVMQHKIHAEYLSGESIHWGIYDKGTDKIIGTCGFYRGFGKGYGELGCVLLPQFYGKGYMTAALQLAIEFGKNQIGLTYAWAATSAENQKAKNLLNRLKFVEISNLTAKEAVYELRLKG